MRSSTTLLERLARISRAAFGIVAALGAAAIWGWVIGVPALRDLGADFAPISPAAGPGRCAGGRRRFLRAPGLEPARAALRHRGAAARLLGARGGRHHARRDRARGGASERMAARDARLQAHRRGGDALAPAGGVR